ncbi:MAG: putative lipid II flippase FtsW [Actinomycetota bacterium]
MVSRVETFPTRRLRLVTPWPVKEKRARSATVARARAAARNDIVLLLVPTAVLVAIGLVMVLSASSVSAALEFGSSFHYFFKQSLFAVLGVALLVACSRVSYGAWRALALPVLIAAAALLLLVLHPSFGITGGGSARWLQFGPVTVQPSEIAKLGLIAFAAMILERKARHLDDPLHLALPLLPVVLVIAVLVMLQPDLGTTLLLAGSVLVVMFLAGVRLRLLAAVAAIGALLGYALIMGESYRRSRFLSFLDPWSDPQNTGYHLKQSLIALGSGGWTGLGLGASRQKWLYLPNAETDFIFSILGEELGLFAAFGVLALFAALFVAGIRIAMRAPDPFGRMLAGGITGWLGIQTIVNLGAVTGLLPITGVPLPLLSYGGSNLVVTLAAIGILWSVARAAASSARGSSGRARSAQKAKGSQRKSKSSPKRATNRVSAGPRSRPRASR